jgi:HEAT repeat protein
MQGARYDRLVRDLAVEHRARAAMRGLRAAGVAATPAVRRGLAHPDARVRVGCCDVLDHFLDRDAIPELVACLGDDEPSVRARALHALGCDRCKEGSCRPAEAEVVPLAIRFLEQDPDRYVRKEAAGMLGPAVHRRADVLDALVRARHADRDPLVRKVAGWYCPDGPIYARLRPRTRRRGRRLTAPA